MLKNMFKNKVLTKKVEKVVFFLFIDKYEASTCRTYFSYIFYAPKMTNLVF